VAAAYPSSSAVAGVPAAELDWARFFGDARLQRLLTLALDNNRDLRVAVLGIERARAQYQVQRADQWPSIGAGITGSRQPASSGDAVRVYTAGLQLSAYEIDLFGRVRSLSDAALAQYLASEEGRKAAQISLVGAVARAYLALLADDEMLALTQRTLGTRQESLKLTQLKFDNGAVSELDLRQAASLVEGARAAWAQLKRQRALDENALVLLLGQPLPRDLPPPATLATTAVAPDVPAGLPSDLLNQRPDIRQAEQQLRAANASIGAARAAMFPRITLTASAGSASGELSGLFESGSGAWSFSAQLLQPIFDAGRNRANLEVSKVDRDIAVAQYEKSVQTAFREVADALAGRDTLGEQYQAQQAQADAEGARFTLSDLRYRNGVASFLDLLDAQRALFTAQLSALQVRLAQLQNQVTLYQALGGGWREPAAP
jgi:multidrug efflux system outer membrane protein